MYVKLFLNIFGQLCDCNLRTVGLNPGPGHQCGVLGQKSTKNSPAAQTPYQSEPHCTVCVCLVLITEVFHRWVKCKLQRVQHDKWSTKKNNNFSSVCVSGFFFYNRKGVKF